MNPTERGSGRDLDFVATRHRGGAATPAPGRPGLPQRVDGREAVPVPSPARMRCRWAVALGLLGCGANALADTPFDAPGNSNPIIPGYFADPTIKQFGDTFHLYATTDGNGGGRGPAVVWLSKDFVNWVLVPMNWPSTPHYWAPEVIQRPDGRYYLFYSQPCSIFGGVADSPMGPWTPLTPGDGLIIPDRFVKEVITLDFQLFEDRDGTLYGHWGTWGIYPNSGCGWGVLNPDMKSFARLGMIPNTQAKDFFEGPYMIERNGVYYFTYSSGSCGDSTYRVQYAVSDKPDGEFKMGPNNPILSTTPDGKVDGPGHHSFLKRGDDYFIVYHRHDLPVTPNGMHRQTCADRLVFERDGVIRKVEPTHAGIGALGPATRPANLAFGKAVTASSWYRDTLRRHEYHPAYAVDDNNATLWRPADNRMGHWLAVDLGSVQTIRRVETQFEYGTWFYQYLIEASTDGQSWTVFADRRQNTRWGSPMVDDGDVEARHLRLTVTGTEFPGLFGAVWNLKAYAGAPADPLLAMADRAFAEFIEKPRRPGTETPAGTAAGPDGAGSLPAAASRLLLHLDAADLALGTSLAAWTNRGVLGGAFLSAEARPVVGMAAGRKAVRFSGKELLTATFRAPRSLSGNSAFTVAAWVCNPEIGESECYLSWAGRGGPDATTAQFGYGRHPEFGAAGHWGFADLGFRGGPPKAGEWHHLAVVFDGVVERVYVDGQANHAEAKMLMMHPGRPVYVGASEPGTEHFDGYLASLRVYDGALDEAGVRALAADAPSADVLVHFEAARLDYGPLASWTNQGAAGGVAQSDAGQAPVVEDVEGRLAVRFGPGQSLTFKLPEAASTAEFTMVAEVIGGSTGSPSGAVEFVGPDAALGPLLPALPRAGWHQVALIHGAGRVALFADGVAMPGTPAALPATATALRLGGARGFSGAVSRVQWFRRALAIDEIESLHRLAREGARPPVPDPAAFASGPVVLGTRLVAMAATPASSAAGGLEYLFSATAAGRGATWNSGWTPAAFLLDDGPEAGDRVVYSVKSRDALGNVTASSQPVEVSTAPDQFAVQADPLAGGHDFLAAGVDGTGWSGLLGKEAGSTAELIAITNGVLRLQSRSSVWDGGRPVGPFLFREVAGDFVAEVEVADYAGLATRRVPGNNDGGLMVRVPDPGAAGPGEDLVQLNFFPIWNQGNMVTTLDGGRLQKGNMLAWEAHRHLQIIRHGPRFHFRTSPDGQAWREMPGSPVTRDDMAGLPLQVGLYHASYGSDSSFVTFRNFRLVTRQ